MKKIIITLITLITISITPDVYAQYMGGEITWECQVNGNFRFIVKLYRDCYTSAFPDTLILNSNSPAGNITLFLYPDSISAKTDISPVCNQNPTFPHITCATATAPNMGAVEELVYTSDSIFPNGVTLNGVPPVTGWRFNIQGCCRGQAANLYNPFGYYLNAVMYPYNNQNTYPCFDSSPDFSEKPLSMICIGYPLSVSYLGEDKDLDLLYFEWAPAMADSVTSCLYDSGYTYNNLGSVDTLTGEISFQMYQYALNGVVKILSYKCGIKVAEVFREYIFCLMPCGLNDPPIVTPPFQNDSTFLFTEYKEIVYAGDLIKFNMSGTDFQFLPNSQPQTITIEAAGLQIGAGFTSTTSGCLNPPCATLNPAPPVIGHFGVQTTFNWQTDCAHLLTNSGCGLTPKVYNFLIKVKDDYCPSPAINISTITLVVLPKPKLPPPKAVCISVDSIGKVNLKWKPVKDTLHSFNRYDIYVSQNLNGPYICVDSLLFDTIGEYYHNSTNLFPGGANTQSMYYYVVTRSGSCLEYSSLSDTLRTIFLEVNNTGNSNMHLTWNSIHAHNLSTLTGWYMIYRKPHQGNWTLIDSTQHLFYDDTIKVPNPEISYKIKMLDTSGCISVSSIDKTGYSLIDVGISKLYYPAQSGSVMQPKVTFKNYSAIILDTIDLIYNIIGGYSVYETWTGTLNSGDSVVYTFHTHYTYSFYPHTLCVKVLATGDNNIFNDNACIQVYQTGVKNLLNENFNLGHCIPNPASDKISVEYIIPGVGEVNFKIIDMIGKEVYYRSIKSIKGKNKIEVNINKLKEGIYIYLMEYNGEKLAKKMVVVR